MSEQGFERDAKVHEDEGAEEAPSTPSSADRAKEREAEMEASGEENAS